MWGDRGGSDCWDRGRGRGGGFMGCEEWGGIFNVHVRRGVRAYWDGGLGMEERPGIALKVLFIRVSLRMGLRMRLA